MAEFRNSGKRNQQRGGRGRFSNSKNVTTAKTVQGTTSGGSQSVRGRGPVINGNPRITGPQQQLRLPAPEPMKDVTQRSPARPNAPARALPAPSGASTVGRVARGIGRALGGVATAVGAALAPSSLGSGTIPAGRTANEEMIRQEVAAGKRGPQTRPRGGPRPEREQVRELSSGPTTRPRVNTRQASTSGVTQASTSTSPAVQQAASTPVKPSKAMGAVAGVPGAAAGPKEEKRKSRLKGPRMMDEYRSR